MQEIARDVALIKTLISNAYLIGNREHWVLVDALTPGRARTLKQAAEARFGPNAHPQAIVLTHGHVDHAGSAAALADFWGVRIYAHRHEYPYLTGRSEYPPLDHTAPGFFSSLSRLYPVSTCNLGCRVAELHPDRPLPWLQEWQCCFTPGHSPGHVAFFRRDGRVLLAGDAVTTMNLVSFSGTLLQRPQLCGPPVPATIDWQQARRSVEELAALAPDTICAGHGRPLFAQASALCELARNFPIPPHGRYVQQPAITSENGVEYLPPAPFDITPKLLGAAAITGLAFALLRSRAKRARN